MKYNGTFIFDVDSLYKMDYVLDGYFEEDDDEEFYFKWAVKKTGEGKVEHLVEIIDKENNEHINEIHHQQTYSIDTYLELLKKLGLMKLNIMVSLKSIMINHNELFLYAIKEGKECNDWNNWRYGRRSS